MPTVRKLILIPDYKPLYAMEKCFGPLHGPLNKPCPTPVDIIGKLLQQQGQDTLNIFEVVPDPKDPRKMLTPVKLTRDNYTLPYEEIAQLPKEMPKVVMREPEVTRIPVAPKKIAKPEAEAPAEPKVEKTEEQVIYVPSAVKVDAPVPPELTSDIKSVMTPVDLDEAAVVATMEDADVAEENAQPEKTADNPYAGMTKAERKRAQKEARRAAESTAEATDTQT